MPDPILIVDDEAHIRALLEQTLEDLEDEGVELMTAATTGRPLWRSSTPSAPTSSSST